MAIDVPQHKSSSIKRYALAFIGLKIVKSILKLKEFFFKENNVTADVAQHESSNIKRYVSAFSNI